MLFIQNTSTHFNTSKSTCLIFQITIFYQHYVVCIYFKVFLNICSPIHSIVHLGLSQINLSTNDSYNNIWLLTTCIKKNPHREVGVAGGSRHSSISLLPTKCTQQNMYCNSKSMMKYQQILELKTGPPLILLCLLEVDVC
jgi:hypothetical protein